MGRTLALDLGEKRIGVAVSDALNIIAQGLGTIERSDEKLDLKKIDELIKKHGVSKVVIGLAFHMSGEESPASLEGRRFASLLKKRYKIDVEFVDERLTTKEAERVLLEGDVSRKKRKKSIDKLAAQLILQNYLNRDTDV